MRRSGQPLISVVVPTLNARKELPQLLESIGSQEVAGDVETVVVDSSSRDGTPDIARRRQANVLSVPRGRFNHGRTRNEAIQACRGRFIALTVQDALPTDSFWLARLIDPLQRRPDVAGSYGLQVAPASAGLLARARSASWCQQNDSPAIQSSETPQAFWKMSPDKRLEAIRFDNVTSCIRRSIWETLPYPEHGYGEDMAWAKSVLLAGYAIAYVPEARVWHYHERGWWYELRRAYVDGWARVKLVDWPAPPLSFDDVLRVLRRTAFFLLTTRFDPMVESSAIRSFLGAEMRDYSSPNASAPAEIYLSALKFSWSLLETALTLRSESVLPPGVWSDLLRFAMVATAGEHLGAAAANKVGQGFSPQRAPWFCLHYLLHRGV